MLLKLLFEIIYVLLVGMLLENEYIITFLKMTYI